MNEQTANEIVNGIERLAFDGPSAAFLRAGLAKAITRALDAKDTELSRMAEVKKNVEDLANNMSLQLKAKDAELSRLKEELESLNKERTFKCKCGETTYLLESNPNHYIGCIVERDEVLAKANAEVERWKNLHKSAVDEIWEQNDKIEALQESLASQEKKIASLQSACGELVEALEAFPGSEPGCDMHTHGGNYCGCSPELILAAGRRQKLLDSFNKPDGKEE